MKFDVAGVFNFLSSKTLELVVVKYSVFNGKKIVDNCFFINNLDAFFIELNLTIDLNQLTLCKNYVKSLRYPFTDHQRLTAQALADSSVIKFFVGFKISCKLSFTNKTIQCSMKLNLLLKHMDHIENFHKS